MEITFINHMVLLRTAAFSFTELSQKLSTQREYTTYC